MDISDRDPEDFPRPPTVAELASTFTVPVSSTYVWLRAGVEN
ncbi:hypothetical protein [Cryobacterium aureum]|nr:hypothetical protein [Cryobacterium aureum]